MAFAFRYPTSGGTGASSGTDLVTACGTYDPFSSGGTVSIYGKIYAGWTAPTDATPPAGSSPGSCVPGTTENIWHFNGCSPPLSGCGSSGDYVMRVWLTSTSVSYSLIRDSYFTACMAGSGDCVPDCPAPAPEWHPDGGPVIREVASRYFLVVPSEGLLKLLDVFSVPNYDPTKFSIQLTFDENRSNLHRAVWSSKVVRGDQLRLEVTPGGCCTQGLLARVRVTQQQVFTLERWMSDCFDVVNGGPMRAVAPTGECIEGDVIVKPPPAPQLVAPPLPSGPAPRKKAARRRGGR